GAGEGLEGKLSGAAEGAAWGGATGGLVGGVGGALAARSAQKAAPTVDLLKDEAGKLYDAARQSGAMLPRAQAADMATKVTGIASPDGIVPPTGRINERFPKIADLVRSFDDYAYGDLTIDQLRCVRKLIQSALKSTDS